LDNTCFYTKNGHHLGIAFTDLPPNMYPTVGLQTPGEIVEANFGQQPFVFDIEDMMRELRARTRVTVQKYAIPDTYRNWGGIMNKMVMSYLVHHGYCSTAEAFAKTCGQIVAEDLVSMQNRQKIQKLVLEGQIPEAEEETKNLYPNLLDTNPDLLFMLRCRHFVELVGKSMTRKNGRYCKIVEDNDASHQHNGMENNGVYNGNKSPSAKDSHHGGCEDMDITYTNGYQNGSNRNDGVDEMDVEIVSTSSSVKKVSSSSSNSSLHSESDSCNGDSSSNHSNSNNGHLEVATSSNGSCSPSLTKGVANGNQQQQNGNQSTMNGIDAVEHLLQVGRELQTLSLTMRQIYGRSESNKKLIENAFSLLAYADPWNSPVGWQLSPRQREPVSAALNSAILQSIQLPRTPPLQVALNHAHLLLSQQARSGLGGCAFVDLDMQADIK
jgi:hypothetical protein